MYLFLISVVSIFVTVVVAELLTRWFLRLQNHYYVWAPYFRSEMHIDRAFLPRLTPLARFQVNSVGERGEDLPRECKRLYRVLVAGGSPAECAGLDQDDSWPIRLQSLLRDSDAMRKLGVSHVHVGSIGKSGVDAQALDLVFEHTLQMFGTLDLIVIMVGGSNVLNWLKAGAPEHPEYRRPTPDKFFAWQPHGPFHWGPRLTALAEVLRRIRQCMIRPVEVRRGVGKSLDAARRMRANAVEIRTSTPDPSTMLHNFEVALRSALLRAQGSAKRVLVVRQPWFERKQFTPEEEEQFWNGSVGDPYSEKVTIFYSHQVLFDLMRRIEEALITVCSETGTEHIGLQHVLEPSVNNYYDHIHFTPMGCAIVAQEIARYLIGLRPDSVGLTPNSNAALGQARVPLRSVGANLAD